MKLRATIHGWREQGPRGRPHMYTYYMQVRDETGKVWSQDNTACWQTIHDQALEDMRAIRRAWSLGILKP